MPSLPAVMPGKIILCGENPFIWLSETEHGPRTTEASVWTVNYSEGGAGHALFIKSELTDNNWKIYSDNMDMAHWLQTTVQGMLNGETSDQDIPVIEAFFSHQGGLQSFWSQIIKSERDEIVLEWHGMKAPIMVQDKEVSEPGRPYGVSVVMLPAVSANLFFNGKQAKGQIWPMDLNGHPFSTGALAFSENWRVKE